MATEIIHDESASRYRLRREGVEVGYLRYRRGDGVVLLSSTHVDPAYRGHGLAGKLARRALDDADKDGLVVEPFCPFVRSFIAKNPQYVRLVPPQRREALGL